jgi:DNA-binding NtrC family response regulator
MYKTVLLVDDDQELLKIYKKVFELKGFQIQTCASGLEALKLMKCQKFNVVVSDVIMPKMDGMELLKAIKIKYPLTEVIMLTAEGSINDAVKAVKGGAFSYLVKPAEIEDLLINVEKAMELSMAKGENESLKDQLANLTEGRKFIGSSKEALDIRERAKVVGMSDSTVLITGETGTGKEIVANMIHSFSSRRDKPFICVNCAALNENLIEAELFGAEKGAYTGADQGRKGRFEMANGGTLFFDEIGELSPNMQVKLLRVLQEKSFERVGSNESISSDFRLIAATNKNLKEEVKRKNFRADLYYRLNIIPISVPPLRERVGDIKEIAEAFLQSFSNEMNRKVPQLNEEIYQAFNKYSWPGNVRELRNIIERLVVLSNTGTDELDVNDLPEEMHLDIEDDDISTLKAYTNSCEKSFLEKAMSRNEGNVQITADELGISTRSLYRKLNEYDIHL